MTAQNFVFTSESVSEGHPDKVCDQISDAILDALLRYDPNSRVACETLAKNNQIVLAGEISTSASIDFEEVARRTIRTIGYTDQTIGFDANSCHVLQLINSQSPDISQGVTAGEGSSQDQGAGDQGLMFGYACNETPAYMPLPIYLAHRLVERLAELRHDKATQLLRPDAKSQVSVAYENSSPKAIDTIVISTQHTEEATIEELKELVWYEVVKKIIPAEYLTKSTKLLVNPTGRFVIGGPVGDCGLTGRKIIVDTYGGWGRHGGGAFSGKDPSKVDRSAAYAARHIAKNVVAAGIAERCELQLAYAIGVAEPVSILVDTFGTSETEEAEIARAIREVFNLTPRGIIESLELSTLR